MNLSIFIYLLGALLVTTSAIPQYRDLEEKITEYRHNYKFDTPGTPLTKHSNEKIDVIVKNYRDIDEKNTENGPKYKYDEHLTKHANESVDAMVDDEDIKDALKNRQNLGWWWDRTGVHNLTEGHIPATYNSRHQYGEVIIRPYKFLQIVKVYVEYFCPNQGTISYVEAYDLHTSNSSAGYASIIERNSTHVTISLESARNHGLKYYVRVTAVW